MRTRTALTLFIAHVFTGAPAHALAVTGAGSTFVYPLVTKWAAAYAKATGVEVNYQSIGSGGGLRQIENATVDFAATDVPLAADQLRARHLTQFPLIAGAVIPVVHLTGLGDRPLKLSGAVLADIFLGHITRWTDPRVAKLNPGLTLPDRLITVVHRADGSGTTHVFTSYLAAISAAWSKTVGVATAITWPAGVGAKGNEGVAAFVKLTEGAIGYVEAAVATRARLKSILLENHDGAFVAPDDAGVRAAVDGAAWTAPDFRPRLVNAPGATSWPIVGATHVVWRSRDFDASARRACRAFFAWAFANGDAAATSLQFVGVPAHVRGAITRAHLAGAR